MNTKIKIAFVANTSWALYNFRLGLIKKLELLGYEIILIAPFDAYSNKLVAEGFRLIIVPLKNYNTNLYYELILIKHLHKIYKQEKPDFIFHYTIKPNIYGSMMARVLNIPSVAINTGLGMLVNHDHSLVQGIAQHLYRLATKFSSEVWFLNSADKEYFINFLKVNPRKINILPGEGIDTTKFACSTLNTEKNTVKFIFAGRMLWAKGIRELAETAKAIQAKYPNTHFQLLGFIEPLNPNSVSIDQIEKWKFEGVFDFLGETENVIPYIQQADCIVLPSYREGISRLLLEAASMGKPAIASDVVGCREIVEDGVTGFLCKPKDAADLTSCVEKFLLLSGQQRAEMGKKARNKVINEFDGEIVFQHYVETLKKYKMNV